MTSCAIFSSIYILLYDTGVHFIKNALSSLESGLGYQWHIKSDRSIARPSKSLQPIYRVHFPSDFTPKLLRNHPGICLKLLKDGESYNLILCLGFTFDWTCVASLQLHSWWNYVLQIGLSALKPFFPISMDSRLIRRIFSFPNEVSVTLSTLFFS